MRFARIFCLHTFRVAFAGFLVFGAAAFASADTPKLAYVFNHLAGPLGGLGNVDGAGVFARFRWPGGVAVDSTGTIYVADSGNDTIRKISSAGVVTTLAGTAGQSGLVDGAGAAARFNSPQDVAVDSAGNVYVADMGSHSIRKITPAGLVTTLAGGEEGAADGTGAAAQFYFPRGVAVDTAGNVYVADANLGFNATLLQSTIRKITPLGVVTTLATGFNQPSSVAVDGAGNVYVADSERNQISKITAGGLVTTFAGGQDSGRADGTGNAAQFNHPKGLLVDSSGNVYVADWGNHTIRKVTPTGEVTTFVGIPGQSGSVDGMGAAAQLDGPSAVAMDNLGNIYVAESGNSVIRKVTPGRVVTTVAGAPGPSGNVDGVGSVARFQVPHGVAVDGAGNVYVADTSNCSIRKITPAGMVSTLAGSGKYGSADGTGAAAEFKYPWGVAVDSEGYVYVADWESHAIRKISPVGVVTTLAGGQYGSADGTGAAAQFLYPQGVAVDSAGNVYVADASSGSYATRNDNKIRKITPSGVVTTLTRVFGSLPLGITVDSAGNVYFAAGGSIYAISPAGVQTTLAGGRYGSADGTGIAAQFDFASGLAVDNVGNVYVADAGNYTIRKMTPDGFVTTVGSVAGQVGSADGIGSDARFYRPLGIAVDSAGTLYVADTFNNAIRKGVLIGGSRLVNLSTRSLVSTGDNLQIAGFVIAGSEPKQVLIRANGPVLATAFKMSGALPDPVLTLFDHTGLQIDRNTGWGGDAAIKDAAQRLGAFAWPEDSADSALLVTLAPGAYTAHVTGRTGDSGTALIEVYDADLDVSGSSRLINLSTRSLVSTGDNIQIAGFVINGGHSKQVLIRAAGPVLGTGFKLTGVLSEPVLTLFDHTGTQINQNIAWSSDPFAAALIRATADRVGAFAWPDNSADSALLVTLPPGLYTAQVAGKSGGGGAALLEVYDADPQ